MTEGEFLSKPCWAAMATVFADSPRTRLVSVSVVKEQVEITRHMAQDSQQQRNLPAVMNTMIGPVLHQFPECH